MARVTFPVYIIVLGRCEAIYNLAKGSQLPKMKNVALFSVHHCHKIYRVEAIGLSVSNYTFKLQFFVSMWNLGQFCETKMIFCQELLIKV